MNQLLNYFFFNVRVEWIMSAVPSVSSIGDREGKSDDETPS